MKNWIFSLPIVFSAVTALLFLLFRKNQLFRKLKSLFFVLFTLVFISLVYTVLSIETVTQMYYSKSLMNGLVFLLFFFLMLFSVKFTAFVVFDLILSHIQSVRYPRLIKDIVVVLLYIIGLLLFVQYYFQIKITVVLASSAVLTVVAGFALQDILGDLFSGIALNLEESLKIGDWIKLRDYEGQIEQLRWRSIKIRTTDNVLIIIPNQVASKEAMKDFGHGATTFALRHTIGLSYKCSPDRAISILTEAMNSVDLILKEPAPQALVLQFAESSITYELRYFFKDFSKKTAVISEINRKIWYAFQRNYIEFPYPVRDIYVRKHTDDSIPVERIFEILKNNEVLNAIDEPQLRDLAASVELIIYGQDETLIREGETGQYFYYILSGEVEIRKNDKVMKTLQANDYVGEFSLFTGEKTSADVRVSQESKILRISSEKFRETVTLNKNMAMKMAEAIVQRREKLKEFDEKESEARRLALKKESESIFLRIKKYFSF